MFSHLGLRALAVGLGAMVLLVGTASAVPVSDTTTYALGICPVTGGKLGSMGNPIVKEIGGHEVRFCCAGCPAKYEANLKDYQKKVNDAIVQQEKASYPLDSCVVSGEKLGADAVDHVYGNRLVRFCSAGCTAQFDKDPGKYIAKLDEAVVAKQKPSYPLGTCVSTGEKIDKASAVEFVIANRLLLLCCEDCVDMVKKNPGKYLSMLDKPAAGKAAAK